MAIETNKRIGPGDSSKTITVDIEEPPRSHHELDDVRRSARDPPPAQSQHRAPTHEQYSSEYAQGYEVERNDGQGGRVWQQRPLLPSQDVASN